MMAFFADGRVSTWDEAPWVPGDEHTPGRYVGCGRVDLRLVRYKKGGAALRFGTQTVCRWREDLPEEWQTLDAMEAWADGWGVLLATINGEQVWPMPQPVAPAAE